MTNTEKKPGEAGEECGGSRVSEGIRGSERTARSLGVRPHVVWEKFFFINPSPGVSVSGHRHKVPGGVPGLCF